jgi:hypothetical protein
MSVVLAGDSKTHEPIRVKLSIPILVSLAITACEVRGPSEGDEIGESDSTSTESDSSESGLDDATDSDTTAPDLPEDDPCLAPTPGQLCLYDGGFLFSVVKPSTLLVEDLDGDARLDVIAISIASSLVRVAPGLGDGEFGDWIDSNVAAGIRGAALGRIDDDEHLDLVVANLIMPAGTGVAHGEGGSTFGVPLFKQTGMEPRAVVAGSIDDDEWTDVAVVDEDGDQVFVLLGDGLALQVTGSYAVGDEPYDLTLGDLDLDGIDDLATVDHAAGTISVLWGEADGVFSPAQTEPIGAGPRGIGSSDLDGDGDLDLLSADFDADTVSILINRTELEPRTFAPAMTLPVGDSPYAVAAGDITGDGLPDIVSADSGAAQASVMASIDGRGFAPAVAFEVGFEPFDVELADLDGDARLDVLTADFASATISLLTTSP